MSHNVVWSQRLVRYRKRVLLKETICEADIMTKLFTNKYFEFEVKEHHVSP